jgi:hypothetical protein
VISADELDAAGDALEAKIRAGVPPRVDVLRDSFPQQRAWALDPASLQVVVLHTPRGEVLLGRAEGLPQGAGRARTTLCPDRRPGAREVKRIWWTDPEGHRRAAPARHPVQRDRADATLPNGEDLPARHGRRTRRRSARRWAEVPAGDHRRGAGLRHRLERRSSTTCFGPAVADYRGSICMLGTPGLIAKGLFYEATRPSGRDASWVMHEWTTLRQPAHAPCRTCETARSAGRRRSKLKRQKPGVELTPVPQQLPARVGGRRVPTLVYRYLAGRNDFDELPSYSRGEWHYVNGTDLGYNDATSG